MRAALTLTELYDMREGDVYLARILKAGPYEGHWAHLAKMLFTVGVMVSHRDHGNPVTRWCFPSFHEAKSALENWDGTGDPPGEWIKQKGKLADGSSGDRRRVPDPYDNADGTPKRGSYA